MLAICSMAHASNLNASESATSTSTDDTSNQAVAKKLNNALAPIIFVPISTRYMQCTSPDCSGQNAVEVSTRPTIPISINDKLTTINHIVIPYFNAPEGAKNDHGQLAFIGKRSNFVNPVQVMSIVTFKKASGWNTGIGPYVNIPVMKGYEGTKEYTGIGVAGIISYTQGGFVGYGTFQNAWNIGNKNQFFLFTPAMSYNFPSGWFINTAPYITANFSEPIKNNLTLPLGGGGGKVVKFGDLPVMFAIGLYGNVVRPELSPNWTARFTATFAFPE